MFIDRCGRLGARRAFSPTNAYTGLYALDTFDVRNAFSVGGRLNVANIQLQDQLGSSLNETIMHFNQVIGATYKISSDVTAYAGFSEADHTPTPSELGCANPAQPCIIASFLVSDPPLKQVIALTFEAGRRGTHNYGEDLGTFGGAPFTDPRTLNPAQPHSVYASLKDTF